MPGTLVTLVNMTSHSSYLSTVLSFAPISLRSMGFIWVVHNLPPDMHYKKVFVVPAAIVPGPKKSVVFLASLKCNVKHVG